MRASRRHRHRRQCPLCRVRPLPSTRRGRRRRQPGLFTGDARTVVAVRKRLGTSRLLCHRHTRHAEDRAVRMNDAALLERPPVRQLRNVMVRCTGTPAAAAAGPCGSGSRRRRTIPADDRAGIAMKPTAAPAKPALNCGFRAGQIESEGRYSIVTTDFALLFLLRCWWAKRSYSLQ